MKSPSSFSVLVIFICLSFVGIMLIPKLNVQLKPTRSNKSMSVHVSWQDASAKVLEQRVTAKLEGLLNRVRGVKNISSTTKKGGASIDISFKKQVDMDAVRFEIANLIRQVYSDLPKGVSYPGLSMSSANESASPILSYSIQANQEPYQIKARATTDLLPKLSVLDGVNKVNIYGAAPMEWRIVYDTNKLKQLNLTVAAIKTAVGNYLGKNLLGSVKVRSDGVEKNQSVVLASKIEDEAINWSSIPIQKVAGRLIYLTDIAQVLHRESNQKNYHRVNGLNTINMVIYGEKSVNTIDLAKRIRGKVRELKKKLPSDYHIKTIRDASVFIEKELTKIQKRSLYSFLILLVLIILLYRNFRYLSILFLSLIFNLLIAVVFYYLLDVQLQLYSFAGITISFGIILDNSIVMIDHLIHKKDKKVFLAILAATLTTIAALMMVFFLDEQQRLNLWDFALVIAINIGVSLVVALYGIPALMERFPLHKKKRRFSIKRKRRIHRFTMRYFKVIRFCRKPRLKWFFVLLFILSFGLPVHILPEKLDKSESIFFVGKNTPKKPPSFWVKCYDQTLGSDWYKDNLKTTVDRVLGGSLRLFMEHVSEKSYYSEPERTRLDVVGSMPEGGSIQQLNTAVVKMEEHIAQFDEVDIFETDVSSSKSGAIAIYFKEEAELSGFPYRLKNILQRKAIALGGLDWRIYGVGRGFNNSLSSGFGQQDIALEGYNYPTLYRYALAVKEYMESNYPERVKNVVVTSNLGWWSGSQLLNEYYLVFNQEKLADVGVNINQFCNLLKEKSYYSSLTDVLTDGTLQNVKMISDLYGTFDVWHLKNDPIRVNGQQYTLGDFVSIEKKLMGNDISKNNQQYRLKVAYDFIGVYSFANRVRKEAVEEISKVLPMGYRVTGGYGGYYNPSGKKQYYYLFVIVLLILFICAIVLESLRQPFAIISMIPFSFIGVFLTFYLFDFNFDQGGYASFILLCGISVNAALFIANEYNNLLKKCPHKDSWTLYFKAFNHKIIPILLTIVSTIIGLIPFVWSGQNEVFWFSFAAGAIGGLVFSLIGLYFYLPIWFLGTSRRKRSSVA